MKQFPFLWRECFTYQEWWHWGIPLWCEKCINGNFCKGNFLPSRNGGIKVCIREKTQIQLDVMKNTLGKSPAPPSHTPLDTWLLKAFCDSCIDWRHFIYIYSKPCCTLSYFIRNELSVSCFREVTWYVPFFKKFLVISLLSLSSRWGNSRLQAVGADVSVSWLQPGIRALVILQFFDILTNVKHLKHAL